MPVHDYSTNGVFRAANSRESLSCCSHAVRISCAFFIGASALADSLSALKEEMVRGKQFSFFILLISRNSWSLQANEVTIHQGGSEFGLGIATFRVPRVRKSFPPFQIRAGQCFVPRGFGFLRSAESHLFRNLKGKRAALSEYCHNYG